MHSLVFRFCFAVGLFIFLLHNHSCVKLGDGWAGEWDQDGRGWSQDGRGGARMEVGGVRMTGGGVRMTGG